MAVPEKYSHIDFTPPQGASDAASLGLEYREEFGRGGTEFGVARARDLKNKKSLSPETIKRMVSYFARHEVDRDAEGSESSGFWGDASNPSAGYIVWLLWGGDPGRTWANKVSRQMESADEKSEKYDSSDELKIEAPKDALGDGVEVVKFCKALHDQGYEFEDGDKVSKEEISIISSFSCVKKKVQNFSKSLFDLFDAVDSYEVVSVEDEEPLSFLDSLKILAKQESPHLEPLQKSSQQLLEVFLSSRQRAPKKKFDKKYKQMAVKGVSTLFSRSYFDVRIRKLRKEEGGKQEEERFVLGLVMEPNDGSDGTELRADTDGEIYNAHEVRKAAHWFMEQGEGLFGLLHGEKGGEIFESGDPKIVLLENYITPLDLPENTFGEGSPAVKKGSWLMGLRINDPGIWERIKDGELNGLSLGGVAREFKLEQEGFEF